MVSIPYSQTLCILCICSNKESAKLRCTELVDCLVKQGYNKRKTNKQIERAFTNFANAPTGHQSHTTCPVYFNVQFHPGLPDIKGILINSRKVRYRTLRLFILIFLVIFLLHLLFNNIQFNGVDYTSLLLCAI